MISPKAVAVAFSCAIFTMASACSGAAEVSQGSVQSTTSTGSRPSPAASAATTFKRLNYQFNAPAGWSATEGYLTWEVGPPLRGTPAFDTFTAPGASWWVVVGKRAMNPTVPRDEWIRQMEVWQAITYEPSQCLKPIRCYGWRAGSHAGLPLPIEGPKAMAVQVLVTHGSKGWVVMCFSEDVAASPSLQAVQQQCGMWLEGFRFNT